MDVPHMTDCAEQLKYWLKWTVFTTVKICSTVNISDCLTELFSELILLIEWMYVLYSELYCGILSNYCYWLLLLQRSLSVPSLEPLLFTDWWPSLTVRSLRPTVYCYANGCTTYDCLLYWTTDILIELNFFHYCKDIHSKPLYALCYSLGFSSLLIYICRCTGTGSKLEASG